MATLQTTAATRDLEALRNSEWQQVTPGERVKIHMSSEQTMGAFSVVELIADPGNGVPMHIHANENEHFVVLEGTLRLAVGAKRLDLAAGKSITVKRGVPHAWCNASQAPVHVVAVFSPGGIEQLFREIGGADATEIAAIASRYGTKVIGPPLEETAYSIDAPRR